MRLWRQWRAKLQQIGEHSLAAIVIAFFLVGDVLPSSSYDAQLARIVGEDRFDFLGWELESFAEKGAQAAVPVQAYLDEKQRAQVVVDYLELARRLSGVESAIGRLYADPSVSDPVSASAAQRAERDRLQIEMERRRPTAEAIVQDQIAAVLADAGLGVGGRAFPPVLARVTPLPYILVISPRDEIKREPGMGLSAGLGADRADEIEDAIFDAVDKSAFVTSIGGLSLYPSMIIETTDLLSLLQIVGHEWVHHWLFFRPLGIQLLLTSVAGGDALTINETVASLIGDEIGILALKRFYPEIAQRDYPPVYEPPKPVEDPDAPAPEPDPNAFNFNREMHETRVQVDEYLATARELKGKAGEAAAAGREEEAASLRGEAQEWIVKAETYMEDRRKLFVENGYWWIRKLNQAYFAFYGSYADRPGASGSDPIGPAVRNLRAKIPGMADFLNAVAPVTTLDDLKRVIEQYP